MTVTPVSTSRVTMPTAGLGGDAAWITATLRPAGSLGRDDADRIRGLLDVLSAHASMVVIDLESTRFRSGRVATAIEEAAAELECHGGCLLCINADPGTRGLLAAAGHHAVIVDSTVEHSLALGQV